MSLSRRSLKLSRVAEPVCRRQPEAAVARRARGRGLVEVAAEPEGEPCAVISDEAVADEAIADDTAN